MMNILPSAESTCIYCSSLGPFSAEHVIPAGMGGDDKRFILRDVVCKNCNTIIFSPLEAAFLRHSPTAFGRIFMQSQGRQRGNKRNPPTFGATAKVMLSEDGYPIEIDLIQNGKPFVLPQLILVGKNIIKSTATTMADLLEFIGAARTRLTDSVICIQKKHEETPATLELTRFVWEGKSYVRSQETEQVIKAPLIAIWYEPMEKNKSEQRLSQSRLFQSLKKHVVMRVSDDLDLEEALTLYRKCLDQTDFSKVDSEQTAVENPLVYLNFSLRTDVTNRVLAKIGINMLAHVAGASYVRHSGFEQTKKSILSGTPEIFSLGIKEREVIGNMFSRLPAGHHLFMIFGGVDPSEGYVLALTVKLYGSQVETIKLGINLPKAPVLVPIIFMVDYDTHSITHVNLIDFAKLFWSFDNQPPQENPI